MNSGSALMLLKRLAAEGVAPWLADVGRRVPTGAAPEQLAEAGFFHGAVLPPSPPAAARRACDTLRPVYEASGARDGHVSVPVDPRVAHDADALTDRARTLFRVVGRPNLLVRIPATPAGIVALTNCVAEGIGVDSTLVFSPARYGEVLDAYFSGMERALTAGRGLQGIACVASFPVGPLDAEAETRLGHLTAAAGPGAAGSGSGAGVGVAAPGAGAGHGHVGPGTASAGAGAGAGAGAVGVGSGGGAGSPAGEPSCAVALAVARQVFRLREERLSSDWWRVLRAGGATPPRLLWTAPEPHHVGSLVGWNTGIVLPVDVLEAASDTVELHGDTLLGSHHDGGRALAALERCGVSMTELAGVLESRELARLQHAWPL